LYYSIDAAQWEGRLPFTRRAALLRLVPLADHANAAYWFRRIGAHPVFEPLRQAAELALSAPSPAAFLTRQARWDPFAFNDLCAASHEETAPGHELCRLVQRAEWELLFDYCYRRAVSF
jgi:hypothetical protein